MMKGDKIIFCFGDSLTAGYGFAEEHSYPGVLQNILSEKGYSYEVINSGMSGETSSGGLSRLPRALKVDPEIFILELGINDGLKGLSLEKMANNLQEILYYVKRKSPGAKIVIAGMQMPVILNNVYIREFMAIYPALAEKNEAILIPFFLQDVLGVRDLNLSDGLHPNKAGYKIIASHVFEVLAPYLDEPDN